MTVKTLLNFTGRHHCYIVEKGAQGTFASSNAAVAARIERMIEDERVRDFALDTMASEVWRRMQTPAEEFVDLDEDGMSGAIRRDLLEDTPE